MEPKRPPKAINVTGLCKLSSTVPNYINVSWTVEVGRGFTISVYFVEKLSSQDLLHKLKSKGTYKVYYLKLEVFLHIVEAKWTIDGVYCSNTSHFYLHWLFLGQRHPDYTRAVIKDKLNDTDNEIATTSCKVSLACPLGNIYLKSLWERHSKRL